MKKLGSILLMLIIINGCGTMKKHNLHNISAPAGVNISPRLMALCDILNEWTKEKGDIKLFVPDELTMQTYALKKVEEQYWVSGFLTVTPLFSADNVLTAKGGVITSITSDYYTFSVPIEYLNELLHLPGITHADCAKPVNLLNTMLNN